MTAKLWWRLRRNRLALWSLRCLSGLLLIALLADFIANEKPLYCRIDGSSYFPVCRQYLVDLGLVGWDARFVTTPWAEQPYEAVVFAPIPYSATTQDTNNRGLVSPFAQQQVASARWRHWLGTDQLGRDVAAGMVAGTRTAMLVGIIAMGIATLLGIFFGAIAGYFGDDRYRISWISLLLNAAALACSLLYLIVIRGQRFFLAVEQDRAAQEILTNLLVVSGVFATANLIAYLLQRFRPFRRSVSLPLDIAVMRLVEVMESVPALLLLLAIAALLRKPGILYVMAIIGLIRWTNIAQFLRAELLRIRQLEYIEAARALGFSSWRIILRHALPNAITPVLIVISFGMASAILLEAFMSFLGIGVAAEDVTWGSMLSDARQNFSAWWLAVFPGTAIFITVLLFNLIGDGLSEALNARLDT